MVKLLASLAHHMTCHRTSASREGPVGVNGGGGVTTRFSGSKSSSGRGSCLRRSDDLVCDKESQRDGMGERQVRGSHLHGEG